MSIVLTGVVLALALLVVPLPAAAALIEEPNATYVDGKGAHPAFFHWSGECNGPVTVSVTVQDGGSWGGAGWSTMVPDPCLLRCVGCPVPFMWTIQLSHGVLTDGGMAGLGSVWSLEGPVPGGVLEARAAPRRES